MPKLVFSRHGLSEWNKLNQFTGWADVNLAPEGIEEAKKADVKSKKLELNLMLLTLCFNSCNQNM